MEKGKVETAERIALNQLDRWNDIAGVVEPHTGYYYELQSVIKDAVHIGIQMATSGKVLFDSEGGINIPNSMKNILILLFLPFLSFGQHIVTKDSSWQVDSDGKFYTVRQVEYSNGESSLTRSLVGDTASVFRGYLAEFEATGNWMANAANEARTNDKEIRTILQRRDTILAKFGRDITDTLTAKYAGPLLISGWVVYEDTAALDVVFSVNAQGQLRYQITGYPARNAFIIARTMRLQNYKDTGRSLDIYAAPGGNWGSADDRVRMRLPGNQGLNRGISARPKPAENSGILLEYFTDGSGKVTFFAGDAVKLKKSGLKYVVNVAGKTFEITEKKK